MFGMWVKDCNNVWNVSKKRAVEIDELDGIGAPMITVLVWTISWWWFTLGRHCHRDAMSGLLLTSLAKHCWSNPPSCPPCIKQVSSINFQVEAENNAQKPHTLQIVSNNEIPLLGNRGLKIKMFTMETPIHVEPTVLLFGRSLNGNFRAKEPSKLHARIL